MFMATLDPSSCWIPPLRGKCVAYIRVSSRRYSRLREGAQRRAIAAMLPPDRSKLIREFIEPEPLEGGERPALIQAVALCKDEQATLLLGQIDRMRSAVRWLGYVAEQGVKFRGVDAPHINHLSFNRLVISDQYWRQDLGKRVCEGLTAANQRGLSLGGDRGYPEGFQLGPAASLKVRQAKARSRDTVTWAAIKEVRYRGVTSLTGIAKRLNQMGHTAPRGGRWSPAQVRSVIKKFEE